MPDYSKISKTLKKLNLSHLEDTFKAYGIHDYVVLSLTSSQEERFRREFMILCTDDEEVSEELGQGDRHVQVKSNTENQLSNPEYRNQVRYASTKLTESSNTKKPQLCSDRKNLKTAGIIGASVLGASALAVVAAPVAIAAAGFGSAGVVAGSIAATWQATMGGYIAASSLFATLQSVGAVGLSAAASASIGVGGAVVCGATATGIVALTNNMEKKDQGTQTS